MSFLQRIFILFACCKDLVYCSFQHGKFGFDKTGNGLDGFGCLFGAESGFFHESVDEFLHNTEYSAAILPLTTESWTESYTQMLEWILLCNLEGTQFALTEHLLCIG